MKFSMKIFQEYLKKYDPVAIIHSKEPTIHGVKLFSYERTPDPDYLYVGHNNDFFSNADSREILLVHRQDVISLSTSELEDVFNEVMECVSFYSEWEQKMLAAYKSPNPEQTIIDSCKDVFGPMFFTTMSLQITAISRQYPKGSINRNWDDFLETGTLSLERFAKMQGGAFMERHNQILECGIFYEDHVEEYQHSIMVSQVNLSGKLTGQMTIISKEPFEEWQIQLIPPLKNALCMVSNALMEGDRGSVAQSVFLDLISGNKNEAIFLKFHDLMGWAKGQVCFAAVLKYRQSARVSYGYDMEMLRKELPDAVFCLNEVGEGEFEIVCCLSAGFREEDGGRNRYGVAKPSRFLNLVQSMDLDYGLSYPLEGVDNLDVLYQQASAALSRGCHFFYQCGMEELLGFGGSASYRKLALHPALQRILEYDKKKRTDYYPMLEAYLHHERDRVKTAAALYVHKNTLVYRLKKMETLFDLCLDDAYDREYLLISLNCMRQLLSPASF